MMFMQVRDPRQMQAVLIDPNAARREMFGLMLGNRDIALIESFATVADALASGLQAELMLLHAAGPLNQQCADVAELQAKCAAAILVLADLAGPSETEALIAAGADHVVCLGLQSDRLAIGAAAALGGFHKRQSQQEDCAKLRKELTDTKAVFRAKTILIARQGLSEADAHARLQKMSMERNLPLAQMARQIIDAEDLLC